MSQRHKTKEIKQLEEEVSPDSDLVSFEAEELDEEIDRIFKPHFIEVIKDISKAISKTGFSLEEACTLVDYDYVKFKGFVEAQPVLKKVLHRKELEYKESLLKSLSAKARTGDDKLAQWLLERRYPEFTKKRVTSAPEDDGDVLAEGIAFIQDHGDNNPIVSQESGAATTTKGALSKEDRDLAGELDKILV